jgi:cyclase
MRRGMVLTSLMVAGTGSAFMVGAQQPAATTPIQVEKIATNLYLLRGGGPLMQIPFSDVTLPASGTTIALVKNDGVVLVDTKLPGLGSALLDALRRVTDKPVTTIINTHTHDDHVGSNPEFAANVEVVAHAATAKAMSDMKPVTGGPTPPNVFKNAGGRGLPTRTFTDALTFGSGNERIELRYFGRAHTGGDTWVLFPAQRVVHAGDVFGYKTFPIVDTNNGGSSVEYANTIATAASMLRDIDTVVSGHYPTPLTLPDLKLYGEFVAEYVNAVRDAKRAGRTPEEFANTWRVPERFLNEGYVNTRPFPQVVWDEVK